MVSISKSLAFIERQRGFFLPYHPRHLFKPSQCFILAPSLYECFCSFYSFVVCSLSIQCASNVAHKTVIQKHRLQCICITKIHELSLFHIVSLSLNLILFQSKKEQKTDFFLLYMSPVEKERRIKLKKKE